MKRLWAWTAPAILAAAVSACAAAPAATTPSNPYTDVTSTPVPLSAAEPRERQVGQLIYRGGVQLDGDDPRFGGWSGLLISTDGKRLLSQSDEAHWLRADIAYDSNGDIAGIEHAELDDMNNLDGKPMIRKEGDAEGLAALSPLGPDGPVLVSFERNDRVWRYDLSHALTANPEPVAMPEEIHDLRENYGLESLVLFKPHSILAIAENTPDANGDMIAWLVPYQGSDDGIHYGVLGVKPEYPFEISDATLSPDGRELYLLERHYFDPIRGVIIEVRRVDASTVAAGGRLEGDVIAQFTMHESIDNMEGIALRRAPDGRLMLYMISDDNYNHLIERTLLLMFEVADRAQ